MTLAGDMAFPIMNTWNPVGIIDIGSNSVRLVVYDELKRHPIIVFNEKVACGLGRELASTGQLSADAMDRAFAALRRFRAMANQLEVQELRPFATAAAREASNGSAFVEQASELCETDIFVMSGKQEAEHAAKGVIAGFHQADGLVGDMGGGSLEFLDIVDNNFTQGTTTPLGGLRLIDKSGGNLKDARKYVAKALDGINWLKAGKGRPFYAVGGTWRALARLHMEQKKYPLHVLHGYEIEKNDAVKFFKSLHENIKSLKGYDTFSKQRRETLIYGAIVMEEIIKRANPSNLLISTMGVREGLLFSLLEHELRGQDPLLASCIDLARSSARCYTHARALADWMDALFAAPGPDESREEKKLRRAVCYLSDIGWRYHSDFRAEQVVNIIAYADFAGASHNDRAFLAASVYFRYRGIKAELPELIKDLLDKKQIERARLIGAAIRLVYVVSYVLPGVIEKMPIAIEDDKLVLSLAPEFDVLKGEKLDKRLAQLAELMDLRGELRIAK